MIDLNEKFSIKGTVQIVSFLHIIKRLELGSIYVLLDSIFIPYDVIPHDDLRRIGSKEVTSLQSFYISKLAKMEIRERRQKKIKSILE